jgi:hypothetical protein
MPKDWGNDTQSLKEKLRTFLEEIDKICELYPQELIEALGGPEEMAKLPVLDLGKNTGGFTGYLDFVRPEQMEGHKIKRGVDAAGRPFITFCAEDTKTHKIMVQTLFQRYNGDKKVWVTGGKRILPYNANATIEPTCNDISRLIRNESDDSLKLTDQRPTI